MSVLSLSQLQQLAASTGFQDPAKAAAIAMAESGGDTNAFNMEGSYGLWQVNINFHPEYQGDPTVLFDPTTNAQAAFAISNRGTNWNQWSTFRCPCTGCNTSGPACYLQWYSPSPAPTPPAGRPASGSSWGPALVVAAGGLLLLGAAWRAGLLARA